MTGPSFQDFIPNHNVIGFFTEPVALKSGRLSPFYVNWRNVAEDVSLLDQLTDYVLAFVQDQALTPECFYGVPEGASKLGIITQYKWAKMQKNLAPGAYALPMGRGKPKTHGLPKDRFFLGEPRGKIIVIEDVTTVASSLLETIATLKELEAVEVICTLALTDRMELTPIPGVDPDKVVQAFAATFMKATGNKYERPLSVKDALNQAGIPYYALSNALELLPKAYARLQPDKAVAHAVEAYFEKYGTEKLTLL